MKDLNISLEKYREENESQGGRIVEIRIRETMELKARWTTDTWEDGVPVTKMFHRNGMISVRLEVGTIIRGVAFCAWNNRHIAVLDFYYGGMWYSVKGNTAVAILEFEETEDTL